MEQDLAKHPPVTDKLIALFFWWLPILALTPVISRGTSDYVRAHAKGVWMTFLGFIALLSLAAIDRGLRLFSETGDALGAMARAVPTFEAVLTDFAGIFTAPLDLLAGDAALPLSTFWLLAALVNTFAVQQGRGPYFSRPSSQRLLERFAGTLGVLLAVLALTVGFVTAGEVGQIYDDAGLSTTVVGIFCALVGLRLLERSHFFSELILLIGGSMILAGLYIYMTSINLDTSLLSWLGVITLSVGLSVQLLSRWWGHRKAHQVGAEKGTT